MGRKLVRKNWFEKEIFSHFLAAQVLERQKKVLIFFRILTQLGSQLYDHDDMVDNFDYFLLYTHMISKEALEKV